MKLFVPCKKQFGNLLIICGFLLIICLGCKNIGFFPKVVKSCDNLKDKGLPTIITEKKGEKKYVCQVAGNLNSDGTITIDQELSKRLKLSRDSTPQVSSFFTVQVLKVFIRM